jgi:hypothetical protein
LTRRNLTAPYKQTSDFRLKFGEAAIEGFPAGIEYDGPLRIQRLQFEAHGFAHTPLDTVSHHRLAKSLGSGEAHTRSGWLPGETESSEKGTRITRPLVVNLSEIAGTKDPDTFGKAWYPGYLSELTVSFLRPIARRLEMTAWPSAVFIRVRNPCVFARRRLFGWKVRFGMVVYLLRLLRWD